MPPELHTYKCALGHVYEDYGPFEVALTHVSWGRITSGPICPTCFVKWVHDNVLMVEKYIVDKPTEVITIDPRKERPRGTKRIRKHSE